MGQRKNIFLGGPHLTKAKAEYSTSCESTLFQRPAKKSFVQEVALRHDDVFVEIDQAIPMLHHIFRHCTIEH